MDYLPPRLASLRDWAVNFAALITADPPLYGLSAPTAAAIQSAVDAFAAAYTDATDPGTRTRSTVAAMREARSAMMRLIRSAAATIRAHPSITAAHLAELGLTIPSGERRPIPAPGSFPLIGVLSATPGRHHLRFSDSRSPDSRAKPPGAIALQLFRAVGTQEAADPRASQIVGQFTRNPIRIPTPADDAGQTATYFARWVTRKGLVGPWSTGTSFTIAA